ncbi:hypothetical protein LTR36_006242 [Oleoguttula mirabilis]|uniref:Uncharacterized protein n=1 Tax=Oleoguttula mirabilis TaxID=1507867 RepID=A0AAV9JCY3_9PEZI|nr:hypothetical protein LTR36_006242 [Oleoguttula mirabilis]
MATRRLADNTPPGTPPASKLLRSSTEPKPSSLNPAESANMSALGNDSLMTDAKEAVVQAGEYAQKLSSIIESLIQKIERENLQHMGRTILHAEEVTKLNEQNAILQQDLAESRVLQTEAVDNSSAHLVTLASREEEFARMRARVAVLEDEAKIFGSRQGFEAKMRQLKVENGKKIQHVKTAYAEKLHASVIIRNQKVAEFQGKLNQAVAAKEEERKTQVGELKQIQKSMASELRDEHKMMMKVKEEKWKEVQKAKEVLWKNDTAELRARHREQLAKLRANVKMVEAAQKVVQLNAEKPRTGRTW